MRRQDQIAEARKLLAHIENRTTDLADGIYCNPVTDYTCPEQALRERTGALAEAQPRLAAE